MEADTISIASIIERSMVAFRSENCTFMPLHGRVMT